MDIQHEVARTSHTAVEPNTAGLPDDLQSGLAGNRAAGILAGMTGTAAGTNWAYTVVDMAAGTTCCSFSNLMLARRISLVLSSSI